MEQIGIGERTIHRFESEYVGTNMYLLFSGKNALIVDPHFDDEAEKLLIKERIENVTVFLTHEHPDHTIGLPWLKEKYSTEIVCHQQCADQISVEKNNRPYLITFVLAQKDEQNGTHLLEKFKKTICPYAIEADETFQEELSFKWNGTLFYFRHTPGHSAGSCCISLEKKAVFTGDSLIWNTAVITRFPGGNIKEFKERTKPYLDSLPADILVLAGHGRVFKMNEARQCGN